MWWTKNHNYLFILLATILFSGSANAGFISEQSDLLVKIKIAAKEAGLPPSEWKNIDKFDAGVCYEKSCLESALEIISAANFRENPCDQNRWLDFVCNRRISGTDPQSQPQKLQEKVNDQTFALLDSNTDSSEYFLLREARTLHYQCLNKEENDAEDVRFILEYTDKFGGWPAFTEEPPTDKFNWLDMVADQNRFEKQGFNPMFFDISVSSSIHGVVLDIGQLYFQFTKQAGLDYANMVTAMQSAAELENPANFSQIISSWSYMYILNFRLFEIFKETNSTPGVYFLSELQELSDKYLEAAGVSQVDWGRFFKIAFNGTGIEMDSNDTLLVLPFHKVMKVVEYVEKELKKEAARVAISNALNLNFVAMLLFETTSIVDDLTTFRCTEESGTRESICLTRVEKIFGHSLSKTYLEKYFNDSEVTPGVRKLVDNIKKGYIERLEKLDWMSNETKEFLYDKVNSIRVHVGPTEEMRKPGAVEHFYEGLHASKSPRSSYPQNFMEVNSWQLGKERSTAREMWKKRIAELDVNDLAFLTGESFYQGVTNAFYSSYLNQIQIECGIIQEPIFGVNLPGFMNYGGLGMVLAHEIGHSFDTKGRKFDKFGNNTVEHWDGKSVTHYNDWVKNISDFGRKFPFKVSSKVVQHLDPNQTINEDIADQLGVRISFNSYKAYLSDLEKDGKKEKVLPGLKKYSPEKLFYMKYANMWCERPGVQARFNEALGVHSPSNRRAILPLFQYKEFLNTFSCE